MERTTNFKKFKKEKLGFYSFLTIILLYFLSLGAELICNDKPLYIKFNGDSYFPIFKLYTEDTFLKNSNNIRVNYRELNNSSLFKNSKDNFMVFTLFRFNPFESIEPSSIVKAKEYIVNLYPIKKKAMIDVNKDLSINRELGESDFFRKLGAFYFTEDILHEINKRFSNKYCDAFSKTIKNSNISFSTFRKREKPPKVVRIHFTYETKAKPIKLFLDSNFNFTNENLPANIKSKIVSTIQNEHKKNVKIGKDLYKVYVEENQVNFPYPPIKEHPFGLDSTGRDVLSRVLYGFRLSVSFAFIITLVTTILGVVAGALQGYFGGKIDIFFQRAIEVWSAMPFLYVMILIGSIYGRSFSILLFCYSIFNWIGISAYVRAEFLKIRKQSYVEAAKCSALPSYLIIVKHILPNAITPVITFFPFLFVGAIGSLAALDYLGFGIPAPNPSLGELLFQAQQFRWAWWLILFPSLTLFVIMLLFVFLGESLRRI